MPEDVESKRWSGYANALLIAIPIILGVTTISNLENTQGFIAISIISGLLAVFLSVLWFTGESVWRKKYEAKKNPYC